MKKKTKNHPSSLEELLRTLHIRMEAARFSNSTMACYLRSVKCFCQYTDKLPDAANDDDIYAFMAHLREKGRSRETMRNSLQGIKYLYKHVYKITGIASNVPYPKKTRKLPIILNSGELQSLFSSAKMPKHQLILKVAYSGGLRRSELSALKLSDIDIKTHRIFIQNSKGGKDRYTLLAKHLVPELKAYIQKEKPVTYLFNGRIKGQKCSDEGLRWAFDQAHSRSNIKKKASLHTLRHCFATHLLAIGTDLVTIQKLMGHDDIRTTMIYLEIHHQVNQKPIICPLDMIYPKDTKNQGTR